MGILRMSLRMGDGVWGLRGGLLSAAVAIIALAMAAPAMADVTYPARPAERGAAGFIADEAKLINDADATKIRAICEKLLTDKRVPLVVCTITSMADHGASGWAIERYTMNLFDEWGIGAKEYDYGILVLVSQKDRKARIELGAGWTRERDSACANIMNMDMVPKFKNGDYSGGILAGVQQLDALGRVASKPLPPAAQGGPVGGGNGTNRTEGTNGVGGAPVRSTPVESAPAPQSTQQRPYSYSNSRGSGGGGLGGFSMACLAIPVIGIIMVLRVLKGAIGWGGGSSGWGRSMYPGGYMGSGMGGWGSGSSLGGGGGGGWSGGGGGFSGGSFGGGSSGGGGASGSW